jgi:phasin family protein
MATQIPNSDSLRDFQKMLGEWRMPNFDMEAVAAAQRKNIEALTQANQLALEGTQAWLRRNLELARQTMEDMQAMMSDMTKPSGTVEERLARQAEFSKKAIEKSLASIRDLTELATKTNSDAMSVLSKRVSEGIEEARDLTQQKAA